VWCISCVAQHAAKCRWTRTFFSRLTQMTKFRT
jgi:hypothetical protein